MSIKVDKFKNAVEEIIDQMIIKKSADDQIKAIKEHMKEENGYAPSELAKYASKLFTKMENPEKYNEEVDLMTRLYEELEEH